MEDKINKLISEYEGHLTDLKEEKSELKHENDRDEKFFLKGEIKATNDFIQRLKTLLQ